MGTTPGTSLTTSVDPLVPPSANVSRTEPCVGGVSKVHDGRSPPGAEMTMRSRVPAGRCGRSGPPVCGPARSAPAGGRGDPPPGRWGSDRAGSTCVRGPGRCCAGSPTWLLLLRLAGTDLGDGHLQIGDGSRRPQGEVEAGGSDDRGRRGEGGRLEREPVHSRDGRRVVGRLGSPAWRSWQVVGRAAAGSAARLGGGRRGRGPRGEPDGVRGRSRDGARRRPRREPCLLRWAAGP